ncbi:MAG: TetR/AcrR family transcriptional regulator [Desulfobacter sp.]|nr:MAG: TetR/AcrR family transcriptional regulator [Desulfobacter sp.]
MSKKFTLEQIYSAAIPVFARYGYKRTRLKDVSSELDMVSGTLYRYVKDKRDLYERSVAYGIMQWQTKVRASVEKTDDIKEKFICLCQKSYQYLSQDQNMRKILMNDPSIFPLSPRKVRFPGIDNTSLDMIKALLHKGVDQGVFRKIDINSTAEFLYSIYVMFIIKTYVKSEGRSSSLMYEQGIELILNGLLTGTDTPKTFF